MNGKILKTITGDRYQSVLVSSVLRVVGFRLQTRQLAYYTSDVFINILSEACESITRRKNTNPHNPSRLQPQNPEPTLGAYTTAEKQANLRVAQGHTATRVETTTGNTVTRVETTTGNTATRVETTTGNTATRGATLRALRMFADSLPKQWNCKYSNQQAVEDMQALNDLLIHRVFDVRDGGDSFKVKFDYTGLANLNLFKKIAGTPLRAEWRKTTLQLRSRFRTLLYDRKLGEEVWAHGGYS